MWSRYLLGGLAAISAYAAILPRKHGQFVTTNGPKFEFDGKPYYYAGTNAYWFSFLTNISDVSYAMDQAVDAGLKVVRTWGFMDLNVTYDPTGLPEYGNKTIEQGIIYYQSWADGKPTINYGPKGLAHFDQIVQLAEEKGMKLIVTLTNNWADLGGMDMYTVNLGGKYHDDFYTNSTIISVFKEYVKAVVTRYLDSPAIFAWQLANEPRCDGDATRNLPRSPNCTSSTLTRWADEVSTYIKSLDSEHMVSVGCEGFFNEPGSTDAQYNGTDGVDFTALTALPNIDYGTFHLYPDWWTKTVQWANQFVQDHITVQYQLNKPVVMEEYGWMTPAARLSMLNTTSNWTRIEAISLWQQTAFDGKLAGDQFWQLGVYNLSTGNSPDDGFTIYLESPEAVPLVFDHVKKVNSLNH